MATTSSLPTNIYRRAVAWAGQLTSLAKSYAPTHIKPYIHSKVEDTGDGVYIIRITADRGANPIQKYGSLDARAQEYGSGIRARRGGKGMIDIVPKTQPNLVFAGTNEWEGYIIRTKHVSSPGIPAANDGAGYIAPAVNELRARGKAELQQDIRQAILSDIRRSFGSI